MDLFTYLMAKNGNNSSVHGDLFSYLLGKGQSQIYTVSGTTIYIPDAKKLVSFMMTKESTQDGEPTPDNPVPVNVVEGYRNLFDISTENVGYYISGTTGALSPVSVWNTSDYIEVDSNLKYILSGYETASSQFAYGEYTSDKTFIDRIISTGTIKSFILNLDENTKYIRIAYRNDKISKEVQLTEGEQELPYVPYGNNYIAVNVSDGTNTNNYPIPLNNNIIAGIGDYKDELKVDTSGNVFINKKTGKIVLNGTEDWELISSPSSWNAFVLNNIVNTNLLIGLSNYFINFNSSSWRNMDNNKFIVGRNNNQIIIRYDSVSNLNDFKTWLGTHNTEVYYVLATSELIDLQTTVDLKLFKGVNNISNSEDGYMTIEYK